MGHVPRGYQDSIADAIGIPDMDHVARYQAVRDARQHHLCNRHTPTWIMWHGATLSRERSEWLRVDVFP